MKATICVVGTKVTICEVSAAKVPVDTIFEIGRINTDTVIVATELAINEARIRNRATGIEITIETTEIEKDIDTTDAERKTKATISANASVNTATEVAIMTVIVNTTMVAVITEVDVETTNGTVTTITAIGIAATPPNNTIPINNKNPLPPFKCKKNRVINKN